MCGTHTRAATAVSGRLKGGVARAVLPGKEAMRSTCFITTALSTAVARQSRQCGRVQSAAAGTCFESTVDHGFTNYEGCCSNQITENWFLQ